jgi:hypothetical protein
MLLIVEFSNMTGKWVRNEELAAVVSLKTVKFPVTRTLSNALAKRAIQKRNSSSSELVISTAKLLA